MNDIREDKSMIIKKFIRTIFPSLNIYLQDADYTNDYLFYYYKKYL